MLVLLLTFCTQASAQSRRPAGEILKPKLEKLEISATFTFFGDRLLAEPIARTETKCSYDLKNMFALGKENKLASAPMMERISPYIVGDNYFDNNLWPGLKNEFKEVKGEEYYNNMKSFSEEDINILGNMYLKYERHPDYVNDFKDALYRASFATQLFSSSTDDELNSAINAASAYYPKDEELIKFFNRVEKDLYKYSYDHNKTEARKFDVFNAITPMQTGGKNSNNICGDFALTTVEFMKRSGRFKDNYVLAQNHHAKAFTIAGGELYDVSEASKRRPAPSLSASTESTIPGIDLRTRVLKNGVKQSVTFESETGALIKLAHQNKDLDPLSCPAEPNNFSLRVNNSSITVGETYGGTKMYMAVLGVGRTFGDFTPTVSAGALQAQQKELNAVTKAYTLNATATYSKTDIITIKDNLRAGLNAQLQGTTLRGQAVVKGEIEDDRKKVSDSSLTIDVKVLGEWSACNGKFIVETGPQLVRGTKDLAQQKDGILLNNYSSSVGYEKQGRSYDFSSKVAVVSVMQSTLLKAMGEYKKDVGEDKEIIMLISADQLAPGTDPLLKRSVNNINASGGYRDGRLTINLNAFKNFSFFDAPSPVNRGLAPQITVSAVYKLK